jgi:uncharacterized protein YciW
MTIEDVNAMFGLDSDESTVPELLARITSVSETADYWHNEAITARETATKLDCANVTMAAQLSAVVNLAGGLIVENMLLKARGMHPSSN